MNEASFYDHAVRDEGLYIRGMVSGGHFQGQMVEIFVDREDAEMFGWIDPPEEEGEIEEDEAKKLKDLLLQFVGLAADAHARFGHYEKEWEEHHQILKVQLEHLLEGASHERS